MWSVPGHALSRTLPWNWQHLPDFLTAFQAWWLSLVQHGKSEPYGTNWVAEVCAGRVCRQASGSRGDPWGKWGGEKRVGNGQPPSAGPWEGAPLHQCPASQPREGCFCRSNDFITCQCLLSEWLLMEVWRLVPLLKLPSSPWEPRLGCNCCAIIHHEPE